MPEVNGISEVHCAVMTAACEENMYGLVSVGYEIGEWKLVDWLTEEKAFEMAVTVMRMRM